MKNTNKMKTMKTICILAAFLGLPLSTLFAAGTSSDVPAALNSAASNIKSVALAPVTPAEATFEEITDTSVLTLAPVTPKEAEFEDAAENSNLIPPTDLAPATPAAADFEDYI